MPEQLSYEIIKSAVAGTAAAFRCVTEYQPAGGPGDKIFPPTYESGKYACETRYIDGQEIPCVLLDSVQSQANRMELALLDAWERKLIPLPVITVDFTGKDLPKPLKVTSLEAPHRIADALLRDSLLGKVPFRSSPIGERINDVDIRNATALFEICPTSLVFGMWDSTGPRGGGGAKIQRAMVSEMIGLNAVAGKKTSSRIDPAQIMLGAGPIFKAKDGGWTLDEKQAARDKKGPIKLGKDGKPSEANHGNVTPGIVDGGFTISRAIQTSVLSLPALRRLRFPLKDKASNPDADNAGRTALAALALCAAALAREQGCDLRSRCLLVASGAFQWELLDKPGELAKPLDLSAEQAVSIFKTAVQAAKKAGLPWMDQELSLTPSPQLVELVRKSQLLAAKQAEVGGEEN